VSDVATARIGEPTGTSARAADSAAVPRAVRPHHALVLYRGGSELFAALVEAIDGASREVLLETYMFEFAGAPLAVAGALERAAARGVRVCVVMDGIGTGDVPSEWQQRWTGAGVQWRLFNPAHGWRLLIPRRWRRLHRKLCVVDEEVAFCGGINLLDDLRDPNYGTLDKPRFDFAVRVEGPLVADVHDTMIRLWLRLQLAREVRQADLEGAVRAARAAGRAGSDARNRQLRGHAEWRPSHAMQEGGVRAALVLRDNVRYRRRIEATYRLAIAQARREIIIANAYFIPGVRLQHALLQAARRGVKVTLLLQGKYEYFMQHHASRAVYGKLLDGGIEIIEYAPSFLHAKVAVMDGAAGTVATVGSSNLDPLSLLLAREANVFVVDDAFGAELRGHLLEAIAHEGLSVETEAYGRRPRMARALSWLAWLLIQIALLASGTRY
jgi:cardiolipin synthase